MAFVDIELAHVLTDYEQCLFTPLGGVLTCTLAPATSFFSPGTLPGLIMDRQSRIEVRLRGLGLIYLSAGFQGLGCFGI